MDTKVSDSMSMHTINNLGYNFMVSVPPIGKKGGFLCAWRKGTSLDVISSSSNIINLLLYPLDPTISFICSLVYGPP